VFAVEVPAGAARRSGSSNEKRKGE